MDDLRKLLENNMYNEFGYNYKTKVGSSNEFIKRALENLKIDDEMMVLNTLTELCSELSMANDNLADDANSATLIKELIVLLDKYFMLPDVGITALNCLNYLLDINPRYTSVITKWNGVPKIIKMTQNFEYFECAETVIKSIEKMSYENPYIMIENDAFSSLLNLIEFCDLSLRKIALKACVNMTNCINNQEFIRKFILPSIPNLSNLARFSGESELERTILDLSVQCIYNIILAIKNYNLNNNMTTFYKVISEHGILENLYDIFLKYLKIEKESVYDDELLLKRKSSFSLNINANFSNAGFPSVNPNSTAGQGSNTNTFINLETFKNIVKIFQYFCSLNPNIANGILNMRILNVIYYILVKELGLNASPGLLRKSQSQNHENKGIQSNDLGLGSSINGVTQQVDKTKANSSSQGYFIEIFNLLISLFPNKNSKGASDRLLSPDNKNFFIYFSEKILSLIINNIVNIPSSNSMVQIFKLLEMYINSSPVEYIEAYVDPVKFANIANKMLDSKDSSYIIQVFSVVEIIMNKIPAHFIVSFIREGVIDNIKNLINVDEANIYIPNDPQAFMKDFTNFSDSLGGMDYEQDIDEEIEMLKEEDNYNPKEKLEALKLLKKNAKNNNNEDKNDSENSKTGKKEEKYLNNVIKIDSKKVNKAINSNNKKIESDKNDYDVNDEGITDANSIFDKFNSKSNLEDFNKNDKNLPYMIKRDSNEEYNLSASNNFVLTSNTNKYITIGTNNENNKDINVFSKENQNLVKSYSEHLIKKDQKKDSSNSLKVPQDQIKENTQTQQTKESTENKIKSTQSVTISTEPIVVTNNNLKSRKKSNVSSGISNIIQSKAQFLSENFFNEDNIDTLLKKADNKQNPREIIQKLFNLRDMLKNQHNFTEESILKSIAENLFSEKLEDTPTFYEIEKSEVILYFAKYLDENFLKNWENSNETDSQNEINLENKFNFFLISKLQNIFNVINYDVNRVKVLLLSLQNCISSMNCFKLYIYDISNYKNYSAAMFLSNLRNTSQKQRIRFNYGFEESLLKDTHYQGVPTLAKITELDQQNEGQLFNDKLKAINSALNSKPGMTLILKDENELKTIKELHDFFKTNIKDHALNVELYENIAYLKDYFLKLKTSKDLAINNIGGFDGLMGHSASSNNIDFYDDIISHIANRKGSDEDVNLTEKLLQRIMERKKSFEQNNSNNSNNNNVVFVNKKNEENSSINNNNKTDSTKSLEKVETSNDKQISNNIINTFSASFNTKNSSTNNFNKILDHTKIIDEKLEFVYFAIVNNQKFFIKDNINLIDFFRDLKNKVKKTDYTNYANDVQIYFNIFIRDNNSVMTTSDESSNYFMDNNLLFRIDDDKINPAWNFRNITNDLDAMEKLKYFYLHKENKLNKTGLLTNNLNKKKFIKKEDDNIITLDAVENFDISSYRVPENLEKVLFEKYYYENIINNPALYCIKRASPFVFLISLFELVINNFNNIFKLRDQDIGLKAVDNKKLLNNEVLENMKVTSLLFKQIKDPYAVSNMCIPTWCKDLIHNFTYLSGFNSRYLLFKITSFDLKRAITNLYIYLKNFLGEAVADDKNLSTFKRHKFKVDRSKILSDANDLMRDWSGFTGFIEFEYIDETGTGLGPTLEFYSLCFNEITSKKDLWYKTSNNSLFPAPILDKKIQKERENIFMLLGFLIARALYDDRLIDLPINSLFWDTVLDRPVSYDKIENIDIDLFKAFKDFSNLLNQKEDLFSKNPNLTESKMSELVLYNGVKIEEVGLTFNVPGYNDFELKDAGGDVLVTINNLQEYLNLTFDKLVLSGIDPLVKAFKKGFNKVFKIESLKCFSNVELEEIICGSDYELWDYESLLEHIIPGYGYDKNSLMYQGLIQIMVNMNSIEKKQFLQFVTGSPRLPLGGFKNLSPKLTVVMKKMINEYEDPNKFLPTVMTCQKNLKIPNYTNLDILKERLFLAMNEGNNAFHLS